MPDCHSLGDDNAVFFCKLNCFFKLTAVERNCLFAENVLFIFKSLADILNVGVVRCGNVDYVNIFVGENLVNAVVHLFNAVFFGKAECL